MGTIKDLVDLTTQFANTVEDRKIASELNSIQTLILKLQSEQASLHETNIELREERLSLKERIQELETTIHELKLPPASTLSGTPTCPNCSTNSKPFFMKPVARDFVEILNATH
jgi:septation ring formation regulator EzrA